MNSEKAILNSFVSIGTDKMSVGQDEDTNPYELMVDSIKSHVDSQFLAFVQSQRCFLQKLMIQSNNSKD